MKIRKVHSGDRVEWLRMRALLWPGSDTDHREEIERFFLDSADVEEVLVLQREGSGLGGFIELSIRKYAEGSSFSQVPYVEGWFVDEDLRETGFGRLLVQAAEKWAEEKGFRELASDTQIENEVSIAAHRALGFRETERIICFLKKLF